jgi:hypothetical protein
MSEKCCFPITSNTKIMENNQEPKETGSNLTGTAIPKKADTTVPNYSEEDDELRKAEDELPDANKFVENTDALIGDVDPHQRSQRSQEEHNADKESDQ